jgi:DNA-directed RNA polymerase specialized sigma24 family protein
MRFFSGFTLAQVGEFLNMPISTVKSREDAILRKMRKKLHRSGF